MRALYKIGQVESIFSSKFIILPNNCQNFLEIQTIKLSYFLILTHQVPVLLSYRNQSIDLLCSFLFCK